MSKHRPSVKVHRSPWQFVLRVISALVTLVFALVLIFGYVLPRFFAAIDVSAVTAQPLVAMLLDWFAAHRFWAIGVWFGVCLADYVVSNHTKVTIAAPAPAVEWPTEFPVGDETTGATLVVSTAAPTELLNRPEDPRSGRLSSDSERIAVVDPGGLRPTTPRQISDADLYAWELNLREREVALREARYAHACEVHCPPALDLGGV